MKSKKKSRSVMRVEIESSFHIVDRENYSSRKPVNKTNKLLRIERVN